MAAGVGEVAAMGVEWDGGDAGVEGGDGGVGGLLEGEDACGRDEVDGYCMHFRCMWL